MQKALALDAGPALTQNAEQLALFDRANVLACVYGFVQSLCMLNGLRSLCFFSFSDPCTTRHLLVHG